MVVMRIFLFSPKFGVETNEAKRTIPLAEDGPNESAPRIITNLLHMV